MKIKKVTIRIALATVVMFAAGTAARGVILDKGTDGQKLRKDIDKQTAKFAICVGKAALECEESGTSALPECDLDGNPPASTVPAEAIAELADDLAKCESKVNLSKKGTDYVGIGCPGDCDAGMGGDQPCANMAAYQTDAIDNTYFQIEALGAIINGVCGGDATCAAEQGDLGVKFAKALFKCITKCENDYKDKKGFGGPDDVTTHCEPPGDANFAACLTKADSKAPGLIAGFRTGLISAISDGRDDLYNEDDCP